MQTSPILSTSIQIIQYTSFHNASPPNNFLLLLQNCVKLHYRYSMTWFYVNWRRKAAQPWYVDLNLYLELREYFNLVLRVLWRQLLFCFQHVLSEKFLGVLVVFKGGWLAFSSSSWSSSSSSVRSQPCWTPGCLVCLIFHACWELTVAKGPVSRGF